MNKYRFNELCKWRDILKEVQEVPFLCDRCKELLAAKLSTVEYEIKELLENKEWVIV